MSHVQTSIHLEASLTSVIERARHGLSSWHWLGHTAVWIPDLCLRLMGVKEEGFWIGETSPPQPSSPSGLNAHDDRANEDRQRRLGKCRMGGSASSARIRNSIKGQPTRTQAAAAMSKYMFRTSGFSCFLNLRAPHSIMTIGTCDILTDKP